MPNNQLTMESQEKLNDIICCPKCYNKLVKGDILTCQSCGKHYPIYNGIPVPILDSSVDNLTLWDSPPESVVALCPSFI